MISRRSYQINNGSKRNNVLVDFRKSFKTGMLEVVIRNLISRSQVLQKGGSLNYPEGKYSSWKNIQITPDMTWHFWVPSFRHLRYYQYVVLHNEWSWLFQDKFRPSLILGMAYWQLNGTNNFFCGDFLGNDGSFI